MFYDKGGANLNVIHPDFGAKGDSVTDDIPAIQACVDAAIADGKSVIVFPPGDYILRSGRIEVYNAWRLAFEGLGARIILRDGANPTGFVIRSSTDIVVRGLTFKNEMSPAWSTQGVAIQNSSRVWIDQCHFIDQTFYGISVSENSDLKTDATACDDIHITTNYFENCGRYGIEAFPKITSRGQVVTGNTFKNCGLSDTSGASIKAGTKVIGAIIANNSITGGNIGLATGEHETSVIEGNSFTDCNQYGVAITLSDQSLLDPTTYPSRAQASRQLLAVTGNTFTHTSGFVPTAAQPAIIVNGGTDVTGTRLSPTIGRTLIEQNSIDGWRGGGVWVRPVASIPNVVVKNNEIRNVGGLPLLADNSLGAYPDKINVLDNYVENNNLAATAIFARILSPGARILRNTFIRLGNSALQVLGDKTEIAYNFFFEPDPAGTANKAAILVGDSAPHTYSVHHNHVDNGVNGHVSAICSASAASTVINEWDNTSPSRMRIFSAPTAPHQGTSS